MFVGNECKNDAERKITLSEIAELSHLPSISSRILPLLLIELQGAKVFDMHKYLTVGM